MKTLRKIIPLAMMATMITGCTVYNTKPGKKENVVGTYELIKYNLRRDQNDSESTYDAKEEKGVVAYFSIASNGYAYYAYKDKTRGPVVTQMFGTFTKDDENPELIEFVTLTDGLTKKWEWEKEPGCLDEPRLGVRHELFKKTLGYTITHSSSSWATSYHEINYQSVQYKRISKEASLAKVNELMGTSVSFAKPYEMNGLSGRYVYRCQPKEGQGGDVRGIYEYGIIDYDTISNGKVDFIYSLKSNPGKTTKKLDISVVQIGASLKIEGLGKTFYSTAGSEKGLCIGGFETKTDEYTEEDKISQESFTGFYQRDLSVDEIIAQETLNNVI